MLFRSEAGIAVGIHGGDGGMNEYCAKWEPTGDFESFRSTPFRTVATHERQIFDTMAAFVTHGLYDRFPNLRVATIENGGMYVPKLIHELDLAYRRMPREFGQHPVEAAGIADHTGEEPGPAATIDTRLALATAEQVQVVHRLPRFARQHLARRAQVLAGLGNAGHEIGRAHV